MNKKTNTSWLPGFVALGITWGSSFLFIKWGLITLTPIGVAFVRGAIGGSSLLIFCLATRTRLPKRVVEWSHLALVGLLLNSLPGYLFAFGETHVSSVMAGLLNATTPLMTVIVITFAFREQRIDINQGIGVLMGFAGIVLVTGAASGLSNNDWKGILALSGATFSYGIAFPYSKRFVGKMEYSSTSLAAAQVTCSAILLSPFALLGGITHSNWTGKSLAGMLILGSVGTGFAYIWNFRNVKLAGSTIASSVTYITPVVATILGIWLLKEPFKVSQVAGGLLVLISAVLVQKRFKLAKPRKVPLADGYGI
ncbi:MAG: EamA family transporter [Actinobacteria bacterium]|nr:EamA family transporter [Actinomycetota bacterium]